jgi:hypothetical protein
VDSGSGEPRAPVVGVGKHCITVLSSSLVMGVPSVQTATWSSGVE